MYNTGFSSGQAVLSESGENKSSTIYKQEQSKTVLKKRVGGF